MKFEKNQRICFAPKAYSDGEFGMQSGSKGKLLDSKLCFCGCKEVVWRIQWDDSGVYWAGEKSLIAL